MLSDNIYSVKQIKKTGKYLREKRPYIKDLIFFYEKLFTFQQEQMSACAVQVPELDKEKTDQKIEHGFPLVSKHEFIFDSQASSDIFKKVLNLCLTAQAEIKESTAVLSDYMQQNSIRFQKLGQNFLTGKLPGLLPGIETQHIENIEFIIYNSIKPCIINFSRLLAEKHLQNSVNTENRVCPVCGEQPSFSVLSGKGARSLICSFCWHEWPVTRIFCPFCSNMESDSLSYLYIKNEKQIRADLCKKCMKYIKSIDLRELDKDFYPHLEIVSSVSLDIKVQ